MTRLCFLLVLLFSSAPAFAQRRAQRFHGTTYDPDLALIGWVNSQTSLADFIPTYDVKGKSAYESTVDYKDRVRRVGDDLSYVFAIATPGANSCSHSITYDADKEELQATVRTDFYKIPIRCASRFTHSYTGENGFGVKKRIQHYDVAKAGFYNRDVLDIVDDVTFTVSMSRDSAKMLSRRLAIAVLVTPTMNSSGDWVGAENIGEAPTLSSPVDTDGHFHYLNVSEFVFYLYDIKTKRILARHVVATPAG